MNELEKRFAAVCEKLGIEFAHVAPTKGNCIVCEKSHVDIVINGKPYHIECFWRNHENRPTKKP